MGTSLTVASFPVNVPCKRNLPISALDISDIVLLLLLFNLFVEYNMCSSSLSQFQNGLISSLLNSNFF
jgi:hypothetical protein